MVMVGIVIVVVGQNCGGDASYRKSSGKPVRSLAIVILPAFRRKLL
ncbi:hypothetical protein HB81_004435 [Salmonella enterica subsp. enterica]|nr:hypothetical protein [Salmonella enterica subsp. enterica]